eukprot:1582028-Rhodomonas_salina.6
MLSLVRRFRAAIPVSGSDVADSASRQCPALTARIVLPGRPALCLGAPVQARMPAHRRYILTVFGFHATATQCPALTPRASGTPGSPFSIRVMTSPTFGPNSTVEGVGIMDGQAGRTAGDRLCHAQS